MSSDSNPYQSPNSEGLLPTQKTRCPDTIDEARKSWMFALAALGIALGALVILPTMERVPVIILGFAIFLPPVFGIIGAILSVKCLKMTRTHEGLLLHSLLGVILSAAAIALMLWVLLG